MKYSQMFCCVQALFILIFGLYCFFSSIQMNTIMLIKSPFIHF